MRQKVWDIRINKRVFTNVKINWREPSQSFWLVRIHSNGTVSKRKIPVAGYVGQRLTYLPPVVHCSKRSALYYGNDVGLYIQALHKHLGNIWFAPAGWKRKSQPKQLDFL